jgi:hypothetical protein
VRFSCSSFCPTLPSFPSAVSRRIARTKGVPERRPVNGIVPYRTRRAPRPSPPQRQAPHPSPPQRQHPRRVFGSGAQARRAGARYRGSPRSLGVHRRADLAQRADHTGGVRARGQRRPSDLRRQSGEPSAALAAHFAGRRWRALSAEMSRVANAHWTEVGSELDALLRESALIHELQPLVNVQVGAPALSTRDLPPAVVRDTLVLVPSVDGDWVEFVAARATGGWMIQRTRRSGADLAVHAQRIMRFFRSVLSPRGQPSPPLAPIVFSWLARRGSNATRLDPREVRGARPSRAAHRALSRRAAVPRAAGPARRDVVSNRCARRLDN